MIVITKGEKGYAPTGIYPQSDSLKEGASALNAANGVTKAQEAAITKRISDMISMGRFLYPSDAEKMADYEVKQLAKLVMNFFQDTPDGFTKPTERSSPLGNGFAMP